MFAAALIVFREALEAALIITIIMAATRGVRHRGLWVSLGMAGGVIGAGLVAALTDIISTLFQGTGQEIVNAVILFLAVGLISWHIVWMNSHGRQLAEEMRAIGKSVSEGEKHLSILALVVGLAVMREGSEIVLMLQGLWSTGDKTAMLGGGLLGLGAGVVVSCLMYLGFLALSIKRVFALTNAFLMLIAAGMAARAANFLVQADILPSLTPRMWDTSNILSDQSRVGEFFAALVGYIAKPNGIEVLFYGVTVVFVLLMMQYAKKHASSAKA
ncbi:MAG TPA: FTR1 family protein [Alphaproteobacteria bacterium]|nr:FTR1 family protein [Alphaproteobacteria bacterium]